MAVRERAERPLDPLAAEGDVDRPRHPDAVPRRDGHRPGEPALVELHLPRGLVGGDAQRGGPTHDPQLPVEAERVPVEVHPPPAVRAGVALLDREEVGEVGRHVDAHRRGDLARDGAAQLDLLAQDRRQPSTAHDQESPAVDAGARPPDEARRRTPFLGHAEGFGLVAVDREAEPAQHPGVADEEPVGQVGGHPAVPVGEAERLPREQHDPFLGVAERGGLGALQPRRRGAVPAGGRAGLLRHPAIDTTTQVLGKRRPPRPPAARARTGGWRPPRCAGVRGRVGAASTQKRERGAPLRCASA